MGCIGLLVVAILATLSLQLTPTSAQTYVYHDCLGVNYTANSTFQTNLQLLLSYASNNTRTNNNEFFNITAGRNPDSVYGLFQCRGDYGPEKCKRCAEITADGIMNRCPYSKEAILYNDECLLHYSDSPFFSSVMFDPVVFLYNVNNASDRNLFGQERAELMNQLVAQAVSDSPNRFSIGAENITASNETMYGLVQCTQDLSKSDCNRCLTRAVSELPICCDGKIGGRSIRPSCQIRYEIYNFLETDALTRAPPPPRTTPPPSTNNTAGNEKKASTNIVAIVLPTVIATVLILIISLFLCFRRKKGFEIVKDVEEIASIESLQFDFATIATATANFSDANQLGEGGFGVVYKGKFSDGQDIAVKRLSSDSGQGLEEFKNEVLLLAKLQHKNLVRLLGFCLEGVEKLLVYEYVPNASLDKILFDPIKSVYLNWERRYKIIGGIARGLLYLHEDSRDTIIHRDLKASNVLLDAEMHPKISDFGLAKLFMVDQSQGTTSRVVGTYGYMAPEYAMHGQFSVKSDVYSFGVLALEIITGRRNNNSYQPEPAEDLLTHAWKIWEKGDAQDLLQPSLREDYNAAEVMRCVHIGLLCVQEDVEKRPTMATVILLLNSYSVTLPLPLSPSIFATTTGYTGSSTPLSVNDISISEFYPR